MCQPQGSSPVLPRGLLTALWGKEGWLSQTERPVSLPTARIAAAVANFVINITFVCVSLKTRIGHKAVSLRTKPPELCILLRVCIVPGTVGACPRLEVPLCYK